jgi:uncharacterized protein (DUF433 family)
MKTSSRVVTSYDEVVQNIRTYNREVAERAGLAARIKQHPAWYAVKDAQGEWLFGPSKFIGYAGASAAKYLAGYSRKDGKETEPALAAWFEQVDPHTALGRELRQAFDRFAARYSKTANSRWRVSVGEDLLSSRPGRRGQKRSAPDRIAFDPDICGGRPHIRGTRIRVADIVGALASGDTTEELLADFPYLTGDDISAALAYAAGVVDHRVLIAA